MRATEFVTSYFDAWNHRDPVAVADHLARDGLYWDVPENRHSSHDELVVALREFFSAHRHRYELIGEIVEGTETIAFQYRMCPLGRGRRAQPSRGAEFITLYGGAAMTIHDYYELPIVARTAEAMAPASAAAGNPKYAKYAKSGLTQAQLSAYRQRVEAVMVTRQAWLRPDLTLPQLARLVDCSVNHLSQVINAGFGMSFFDYVNLYRVEHAKRMLADAGGDECAILNIAFASGFNSNSAFYAAFRKFVGQTPARYRRSRTDH
jgi:AraC-like DNA-binding protein